MLLREGLRAALPPDSSCRSSNSCIDTNLSRSRLPLHPLPSLCCRLHSRLHVRFSHPGQRYLCGATPQTSHAERSAMAADAAPAPARAGGSRGQRQVQVWSQAHVSLANTYHRCVRGGSGVDPSTHQPCKHNHRCVRRVATCVVQIWCRVPVHAGWRNDSDLAAEDMEAIASGKASVKSQELRVGWRIHHYATTSADRRQKHRLARVQTCKESHPNAHAWIRPGTIPDPHITHLFCSYICHDLQTANLKVFHT
eukprot:358691-Chlamydomonas_euryale.AAC.3